MNDTIKTFCYTQPSNEVRFGANIIKALPEVINNNSGNKVLILCNKAILQQEILSQIKNILKEYNPIVYSTIEPHSSIKSVEDGVTLAIEKNINIFVAIGGGSVIDTAKLMACIVNDNGGNVIEYFSSAKPTIEPLPLIAIPTTASAAEMSPALGIRNENTGDKLTLKDPKLTPKVVLLDPIVLTEVPLWVLSTTAMNALAHCLEGLYSKTSQPISDALAFHGARHLFYALSHLSGAKKTKALSSLLIGSCMSGMVLNNVNMALHHAICHCIGAKYNIHHGVANTIILPHVLRYNLDVAANKIALAGEAIGVKGKEVNNHRDVAVKTIEVIDDIKNNIDSYKSLSETGLPYQQLSFIAEDVINNNGGMYNPKLVNKNDVVTILKDAW